MKEKPPEKHCAVCKVGLVRNKKYSKTQWELAKFCSRACFGRQEKSQATKELISNAHSGRVHTLEARRRMSEGRLGLRLSEAHKKHIGRASRRFQESERGAAYRERMAVRMRGRKYTPETLQRMAEAQQRSPRYKGGQATLSARRCAYQNMRRVRKLQNGGSHTLEQWEALKKRLGYRCLSCGAQEPLVVLARDHMIPLVAGGIDNIRNIQPLCRSCNSKKGAKIFGWMLRYQPGNVRFEIVKKK